MSPDDARRLAVLGIVAAGAVSIADEIAAGRTPGGRMFAATAVAALLLSIVGAGQPKLAAGIGTLAALGALVTATDLQRVARDAF